MQVLPSLIYIGATGENIQPQGANIAPALISVTPIRSQVGAAALEASPVAVSVQLEEAPAHAPTVEPAEDVTAPETLG